MTGLENGRFDTESLQILTGLALVALGSGMMRYFGLGIWTILDGSLITAGVTAALVGIKGYATTVRYENTIQRCPANTRQHLLKVVVLHNMPILC